MLRRHKCDSEQHASSINHENQRAALHICNHTEFSLRLERRDLNAQFGYRGGQLR